MQPWQWPVLAASPCAKPQDSRLPVPVEDLSQEGLKAPGDPVNGDDVLQPFPHRVHVVHVGLYQLLDISHGQPRQEAVQDGQKGLKLDVEEQGG